MVSRGSGGGGTRRGVEGASGRRRSFGGVDYDGSVRGRLGLALCAASHTSREQPRASSCQVSAQIPTVAEVVVEFDQLDALGASQGQLVTTAGVEVVCGHRVSACISSSVSTGTHGQQAGHRQAG